MYRDYENPYRLEERLEELKAQLKKDPDNIELYMDVRELQERVNFAWQDDEYDSYEC